MLYKLYPLSHAPLPKDSRGIGLPDMKCYYRAYKVQKIVDCTQTYKRLGLFIKHFYPRFSGNYIMDQKVSHTGSSSRLLINWGHFTMVPWAWQIIDPLIYSRIHDTNTVNLQCYIELAFFPPSMWCLLTEEQSLYHVLPKQTKQFFYLHLKIIFKYMWSFGSHSVFFFILFLCDLSKYRAVLGGVYSICQHKKLMQMSPQWNMCT